MMQKMDHICFNAVLLTVTIVVFTFVTFGSEWQAEVTNCPNKVSRPSVTFHSHHYAPKGWHRLGASLYGYYLDYAFNSTNSLIESTPMKDDLAGLSDMVREKIKPAHIKYFDTVELWYIRPEHRLYRIDLKGKFPHDISYMDIAKFYKEICDDLDSKFDVKLVRHVPPRKQLLYDAEGVIPGFRFSVSICKLKCHAIIMSTRVLERSKAFSSRGRIDDVDVIVEDL